MSNLTGAILTITILTISSMLIGVTIASVLNNESKELTTDQDLEKLASQAVDEISTYLQIRDQIGKYSIINGEYRLEKIAILISPLVSQKIDVSKLTIQLYNSESLKILNFKNNIECLDSNTIFDHPIWDNLDGKYFSYISISDSDKSLTTSNILNDYSDNIYIVIKLPLDMTMKYNEKIVVTLFPETGLKRTLTLEAPLPMNQVVKFE